MKTMTSKSIDMRIKAREAFQSQLKIDLIIILGVSLFVSVAVVIAIAALTSIILN
jgi:hypothetical protein